MEVKRLEETVMGHASIGLLQARFFYLCKNRQCARFQGPFTVKLRRIERCPEERDGKPRIDFFIRDARTKYDQLLAFTGNLTIPLPLNDSFTVSVAKSMYKIKYGVFMIFFFKSRDALW